MAKRFRLTEAHPLLEKLDKLFAFADEIGVKMSFYSGTIQVTDDAFPDIQFRLDDIESDQYPMTEFPPTTEYRVTFDGSEKDWHDMIRKHSGDKQEQK